MTASLPSLSSRAHARRPRRTPAEVVVRRVDPPAPSVPTRAANLLLAGVSHSLAGTLASGLGRHPQVCLPSPRRIDRFTPLRYGLDVEAPLEDYDRHFAGWDGERYRLESSPVYFDGGHALVAAVARDLPDVRVLLLLRDPAQRLWTSYADKVRRGRLPAAMPYETFVDRCLALRAGGSDRFEANRYFRTLGSGFYAEHLPAWLDTFAGRVRVVFAEHLAVDPARELADAVRWLGLDPDELPPSAHDAAEAEAACPPAPRSTLATVVGRLWPLAQRSAAAVTADPVGERLGTPRQPDRDRNRVQALYARANRDLAALLRSYGYDRLPDWLLDA
ncbi:MAG TPA: hypothetical protein VEV65_00645 [Kineosporiaceae bacterium]|nr:hypothetical protein [Kineosporiaceae bacterium]